MCSFAKRNIDCILFELPVGVVLGNIVSFALSGVICQYLGWIWVFYIFGKFIPNLEYYYSVFIYMSI